MPELQTNYDSIHVKMVTALADADFSSKETTTLITNLKQFRDLAPTEKPVLEPAPAPVPMTKLQRFKAGLKEVWDNETTRVTIKVFGSLASVGVVTFATVHKDHIIEKQALAQANTRTI